MAHRFLEEYDICWLPVNPYEIVYKTPNWKLKYVPQLAYEIGKPEGYVLKHILCGQDSLTIFDVTKDQYDIILNPSISQERRLWLLTHEIGHIYLNHLSDFEQTSVTHNRLSGEEYDRLELEADLFAGEVLASKWLMGQIDIGAQADIALLAGIADDSVRSRYERVTKEYSFAPVNVAAVLDRFGDYVKEITYCAPYDWFEMPHFVSLNEPRPILAKPISPVMESDKTCGCCGNQLGVDEQANFCIACGSPLKASAVRQAKNCGHSHLKEAAFCVNCGNRVYRVRQGFCLEECEI